MRDRFQCDECHYKTTAKDVLEKHKRLNHRQNKNKTTAKKRINCAHCKKYFYLEKTFKTHMQQVHRDVCDTTLAQNYTLRTHRETMHEEEHKSNEQGEVPGGSTQKI